MESGLKFLPQWTRRVTMEGSGRDPLGLSRVSDALTNFLLPNIITTTDRARYYSFYTWAIGDIEALRKSKSGRVSFEDEFQRREAAFALPATAPGGTVAKLVRQGTANPSYPGSNPGGASTPRYA